MDASLKQLEQLVEREARLLQALPPAAPSPARLAVAKETMLREAARLRTASERWLRYSLPLGIAAAVLLLLTLGEGNAAPSAAGDNEMLVEAWASALEDSGEGLGYAFDDTWMPASLLVDDQALEDMLDSFDSSFEVLEF